MAASLIFDVAQGCFLVEQGGTARCIIGDLCLNFRTVRHRLAAGRIMPEPGTADPAGRQRFVCRLRAMGSRETIGLDKAAVAVTVESVGSALLVGVENTMGEVCFSPDEAVSLTLTDLPGVCRSVFFHNRSNEFQNFDCEGLWWSQSVFVQDPCRDLQHEWGLLAFWEYEDGTVGGILPVTNGKVIGRLRGDERGLSVIAADFRGGALVDHYPLALLAFGSSPSEVRDALLEAAAAITPGMVLRQPDALPPTPLDKLGWCSWNAFGKDVCEADIHATVDAFREVGTPVRFMLLDDGWLHHTGKDETETTGEGITRHALVSFDPDPSSFPSGLTSLIAYVKGRGVQAFGLWHTLNGYWGAIQPESELTREFASDLTTTRQGDCIPKPDGGFFSAWYAHMKAWGVDFVKVDNQGFYRRMLPYERSLPAYAQALHGTLQDAARQAGFPVIHCMATHAELLFNARPGNLLRVTNDFVPNDAFSARLHIVNNFYNAFWVSRLFCPDFDMFQSKDLHAAAFARMLALSHSPIYLTDPPDRIRHELVRQLVGADGCIPRYEIAAAALDFFCDPYEGRELFAVVARHGRAVSVGLFNTLCRGEAAGRVLTPEELGLRERCFVWSQAGTFSPRIVDPCEAVRVHLKALASDIVHFITVRDGFAPVGLTGFMAAPATIRHATFENGAWQIELSEAGVFSAYAERQPTRIIAGGEPVKESTETAPRPGAFTWRAGILTINTTMQNVQIGLNP